MERQISLRNKHGLHMRPAQRIVETAMKYQADVRVVKDKLNLSAKSILDMIEFAEYMVLKSEKNDNDFSFQASGPDAKEALDALESLVNDHFGLE
jgi:phosphocarrier protein